MALHRRILFRVAPVLSIISVDLRLAGDTSLGQYQDHLPVVVDLRKARRHDMSDDLDGRQKAQTQLFKGQFSKEARLQARLILGEDWTRCWPSLKTTSSNSFLRVRDLEKSIRFYQDVLGFKHEGKLDRFEIIRVHDGFTIDLIRIRSQGSGPLRILYGQKDIQRDPCPLEEIEYFVWQRAT
jgi:glyoxalase/bleomycin resistance protein/dioxygenase superfamily protein